MKKIIFILIIVLIGMAGAKTTITDELVNTTGNITGSYFIGDGSLLLGITEDNSSWNESRANTLYYGITNPFGFYNSTAFSISSYFTKTNILSFNYYNSTNFSISDYFTSAQVLGFGYYNSTNFDITDYFTKTNILNFGYYNSTDFSISNYYNKTNIDDFNYYNSTDFNIADYSTTSDITGFNYWNDTYATFNKTYADTLYSTGSHTTIWDVGFNTTFENLGDTLYYGINNPFNYYNSTSLENLSQLTNDLGLVNYVSKWTSGNFIGSLFTTGANSIASDSNSIFQIIGSNGVPQFQIQNGGDGQASFVARSFLVVNENTTRLNQSQNNLCSEWGFTHIDCNSSTTGADMGVQDDFEVGGLIFANHGIYSDTSTWGDYLYLGNISTYASGGVNGAFTDAEDMFCDYVYDNFTQEQVGNKTFIEIISGTYEGASALMNVFINSSCVILSNNPAWINDLSNQKFQILPNPVFTVSDGGFVGINIGSEEYAELHIKIENGTNFAGVHIDDVAGVDQHKSLIIDTDANNKSGVLGINNFFRSSIGGKLLDLVGYYGEFSPSGLTDSDFSFMEFHQLGPKGNNNIRVFDIFGEYSEIMRYEEVEVIDYVGYWDGATLTNITANATSDATDMEIFSNDNDEIYICDSVNLSEVAINLDTVASRDLSLLYYYYASDGNWKSLSVTDTTNGFTVTGSIRWATPSDINLTTTDNHSTTIGESYCVMLKRTRNNVVTAPIEDFFYATGSVQFLLRDDLIKLTPVSTPQLTCDSFYDGAIYYDSDIHMHCFCNGTGWFRMSDPTNDTGCS